MCSQSPVKASAVASGRFRYPFITCRPRVTTSPTRSGPGGIGRPSSSQTWVWVPQTGLPTLYARRSAALGLKVVVDAVSIIP